MPEPVDAAALFPSIVVQVAAAAARGDDGCFVTAREYIRRHDTDTISRYTDSHDALIKKAFRNNCK